MSREKKEGPTTSLTAMLSGKGISFSTTSRFVAAFDRLLGSIFNVPAISIEAFNNRRRIRANIANDLMRRSGKKAIDFIETDDDIIRQCADGLINEHLRKQENKERVAELAIIELTAGSKVDNDPIPDADDEFIDWMNVFTRYAEDASSERLRELWAKVLATRIQMDRAFSFGTLRLLSELDQDLANSFQAALDYRYNIGLVMPRNIHGNDLLQWTDLEDAGFISSFPINQSKNADDNGDFMIIQNQFAAVGKAEPGNPVPVNIKKLTKPGREIAAIIPPADGLKAIETIIQQPNVERITSALQIVRVIDRNGDQYQLRVYKTIKSNKA